MWSRWSESCRFDTLRFHIGSLMRSTRMFVCLFVFLIYTTLLLLPELKAPRKKYHAPPKEKTNAVTAVTVFVRFEKAINILFKRQNIFLLFLINPNVLHSHLSASGSKLNKLDTDTIFHSKQLRRTLKFTDKYGAIEKAAAPTKKLPAKRISDTHIWRWFRPFWSRQRC